MYAGTVPTWHEDKGTFVWRAAIQWQVLAMFVHSVLLPFTQSYEYVPSYRPWVVYFYRNKCWCVNSNVAKFFRKILR